MKDMGKSTCKDKGRFIYFFFQYFLSIFKYFFLLTYFIKICLMKLSLKHGVVGLNLSICFAKLQEAGCKLANIIFLDTLNILSISRYS